MIVVGCVLLPGHAKAALFIQFSEGGGTVNVIATGSLNLSATLSRIGSGTHAYSMFNPSRGFLLTGNRVLIDTYRINSLVTPFGTGANSPTTMVGDGDRVALFADLAIGVPAGYVSGEQLYSTNSWPGSFQSLGLVEGEYVTNFSRGSASDSITVRVVPEPSLGLTGGLGTLVVLLRRRNSHETSRTRRRS